MLSTILGHQSARSFREASGDGSGRWRHYGGLPRDSLKRGTCYLLNSQIVELIRTSRSLAATEMLLYRALLPG